MLLCTSEASKAGKINPPTFHPLAPVHRRGLTSITVPLQKGYKQLQEKGDKLMQHFLCSAFPKALLKHPVSSPESYAAPLKELFL